jgi:hypothetical protein
MQPYGTRRAVVQAVSFGWEADIVADTAKLS